MDSYADTDGRLNVLVVDDTADAADSLAELLTINGFAARVANCGADALTSADDVVPDVVLLDIMMPGMNGHELARRLRDRVQAAGKRPLLVAVTGCGTEDDRRQSMAAGIDVHLVKPADPVTLIKLLRRFERVLLPG